MNLEMLSDDRLDSVTGGNPIAIALAVLSITIWLADNSSDVKSGWADGKAAANS